MDHNCKRNVHQWLEIEYVSDNTLYVYSQHLKMNFCDCSYTILPHGILFPKDQTLITPQYIYKRERGKNISLTN